MKAVSGWVGGSVKLLRGLTVTASRGYPKTLSTAARRGPAWFQALDRNGDGDVSRREFTGPADVFARLDGDGLLSPDEAGQPPVGRLHLLLHLGGAGCEFCGIVRAISDGVSTARNVPAGRRPAPGWFADVIHVTAAHKWTTAGPAYVAGKA